MTPGSQHWCNATANLSHEAREEPRVCPCCDSDLPSVAESLWVAEQSLPYGDRHEAVVRDTCDACHEMGCSTTMPACVCGDCRAVGERLYEDRCEACWGAL